MNEKMRDDFELWHGRTLQVLQGTGEVSAARKMVDHKDLMRVVWEESRAELLIDLPTVGPEPEAPEDAIDDSYMDAHHAAIRMRNACFKAIEAAGLKVAP